MPQPYNRPELTADEKKIGMRLAARINAQPQQNRMTFIFGLICENAKLTKEVNEHRQARDFEPLPVFDASKV